MTLFFNTVPSLAAVVIILLAFSLPCRCSSVAFNPLRTPSPSDCRAEFSLRHIRLYSSCWNSREFVLRCVQHYHNGKTAFGWVCFSCYHEVKILLTILLTIHFSWFSVRALCSPASCRERFMPRWRGMYVCKSFPAVGTCFKSVHLSLPHNVKHVYARIKRS